MNNGFVGLRTFAAVVLFPSMLIFIQIDVHAESGSRTVTTIGARSCADWIEERKLENRVDRQPFEIFRLRATESWLLGLMTGLNAGDPGDRDYLDAVDANTIFDWMDTFCEKNHRSTMFTGAQRLMLELVKMRP
jgi:hypothetical protein